MAVILGLDAVQSEDTHYPERCGGGGIKDKKLHEESFLFITIAYAKSAWHGGFSQGHL